MKFFDRFRERSFFYLENGVNTDTSDPKVCVYLMYFPGVRIRELKKEEWGKPVWVVLGVQRKEYEKDPSMGCRDVVEALERYGR